MFDGEKQRKPRIYVKPLLGFKVARAFRVARVPPPWQRAGIHKCRMKQGYHTQGEVFFSLSAAALFCGLTQCQHSLGQNPTS